MRSVRLRTRNAVSPGACTIVVRVPLLAIAYGAVAMGSPVSDACAE
jgi:hypothetical protein